MSSKVFNQVASDIIETFSNTRPIHANSLLLSIYGDTICPHGGTIWLGSLIKLVEPLGINQRLVRTSVFRLAEKGILQSKQVGRRSYYSLTEKGFRQFSSAQSRIYQSQPPAWDQHWRLAIASSSISQEQRDALRKELYWLGFNRISTGVFGHPTAHFDAVKNMLNDLQLSDHVVLLESRAINIATDTQQTPITNILLKDCHDTTPLDELYQHFIALFQPVLDAAKQASNLPPEQCFLLRILLIHKFRHILLKEPEIPIELLPEDALNLRARELTRQLYKQLSKQSDKHFLEVCRDGNDNFIKPKKAYRERFG